MLSPKKISCVFFYDNNGSKLFEEITRLPEYYLTRTEIEILKEVALKINDELRNVDIIELGSGDCTKISKLVDSIDDSLRENVRYIPVDVSIDAVKKASNILIKKFPKINIYGIIADFISQFDIIPKDRKKVICFLGSTIGNFSMEESKHFLINLNDIMNPGDLLLLGFDMVKNIEVIEKAYNDSKNITAMFNKNILNVVNKLIGTNFDPDDFIHVAFYNKKFSRVEMHLKTLKDLEISSPLSKTDITLKKGEMIHTENSYKYTFENIKSLAYNANLEIQNIYSDKNRWFSLVQLIKN
jgi:L-histidine N-alpha-methyltransferase